MVNKPLDSAACCLTASLSLTKVLSVDPEASLANLRSWGVKRDCCGLVTVRIVARARVRVESIVIVRELLGRKY